MDDERQDIRTVLIFGANAISKSITDALQHKFEIHLASPRSADVEHKSTTKDHRCDFSIESIATTISTAQPDLVISTAAGGAYDTQKRIIDCVLNANVTRFISAEFGYDSLNPIVQHRLPPSRERARVLRYLQDSTEHGRLSWCAIATGCLLDNAIVSGSLGFDLKWHSATFHGSGQERFPASSTPWVGHVVAAVINSWDKCSNQYLYAASMIVSADEVISALQRLTGQTWEVGMVEVEDILREAERRFDRGFPDAGMVLMERSVLYDSSVNMVQPFIESHAKPLLGLESEQPDEVIGDAIHQYKHHGKGDCGCT